MEAISCMSYANYKTLLDKTAEKWKNFHSNLYEDDKEYTLLLQDRQEAVYLPGTNKGFFSLVRYKQELLKDYKQITFFLCTITENLDARDDSGMKGKEACSDHNSDNNQGEASLPRKRQRREKFGPSGIQPVGMPGPSGIQPVGKPGPFGIQPVGMPGPSGIKPVGMPGPSGIQPVGIPGSSGIQPVGMPGPSGIKPVGMPGPSGIQPVGIPGSSGIQPVGMPGPSGIQLVGMPGPSGIKPVGMPGSSGI